MKYKIAAILMSALLIHSSLFPVYTALAEEHANSPDETKQLVQKGLTIYEIDKEVARLNEQDAKIVVQIKQNERDVDKQNKEVENTRKHAGKVLRAYYTGDRDSIWMLMFSISSFADALKMFEYLQMIVNNDHRALASFTESFKKLKALRGELETSRGELQKTKDNYLLQRERLVKLQEELDKQLAVSVQAAAIQEQIKSLNNQWKDQGIPLFREYLNNLSSAFKELPQYVTDGSNKYLDLSNIKNPVITITDTDFNTYLHTKNELLQNLNFEFTEDKIIAKGKKGDVSIVLQGSFVLKENPDMNEVRFIVNQLEFNGFQLPDTTIEDFMKEFKLGFVPRKMVNYLDVVGVEMKKGTAIVKLKLTL
ncbi:coiled-coil domain-containing protein [Paenibacillus sp. GCM10027628]|uniref:coiled-coil domain-containing protein n=1 Tax=Paenibacillus sp. GCM10027628 TaxID=3273413 RepID=UPI00363AEABD